MVKISTTYGKRRTSVRILEGRRQRQSFLASYSSAEPERLSLSVQNSFDNLIDIPQTSSIPPSTKSHAVLLAQHNRWTLARRTPIMDREPVVQISLRHPITPSEEFKFKNAVTDLPDSPLSASHVSISPTPHNSRTAIPTRGLACRNTGTVTLNTISPIPIDFFNTVSDRVAATALPKPRQYTKPLTMSEEVTRLPRLVDGMSPVAPNERQENRSSETLNNATCEPHKRCQSPVEESALTWQHLPIIEPSPDEESSLNQKRVQRVGEVRSSRIISHDENISSQKKSDKRQMTGCSMEMDCRPDVSHKPDLNHSSDPFAEEEDFEKNLSEGFLSECPTGSSTPKLMVSKPCWFEGSYEPAGSELNTPHSAHHLLKSGNNLNVSRTGETGSSMQALNAGQVKKHPSPSKKALEDLEVAFAIYTKLKPLEDGDGPDELAMYHRQRLTEAGCNRKFGHYRKESAGGRPALPPGTAHNYPRRRRRLPCRPTQLQDQDIDDLQ